MTENPKNWQEMAKERLEPAAQNLPGVETQTFTSIAISLKRIADALTPEEERLGPVDHLNEVLHDFVNNLYSSLINARN